MRPVPQSDATPICVANDNASHDQPLGEVSRRFGRNVVVTIIARVLNMARGVVLVPFLLRHIGLEAYGIWTTIFILVTYVGVTTMGVSNVYIKYVAEFHARREYDRANALLSTGLAVTIPLCSLLFGLIVVGWNWIEPLLHLPAARVAESKEAVLIVLGVFLSSIALSAFGDMLTGTQQIATTQVFLIISIVVEFVLIVWLVYAGRGIRGLAEAYLARTIVNDGLVIWWAQRKLAWLHLSVRKVRAESLKYVLHFGGLVQFQTMLSIFLVSVERVVGLWTIGAMAAGLLDVAKKWPTSFSTVPMAFFGALLPASSHVDAASKGEERLANLRRLYLAAGRYANLATAIFVAPMACWASAILHIWLGAQYPFGQPLVLLFVLFSLALLVHMMTGPGTSVLRGMGRVYDEFTYSVPNLLLLAILLPAARLLEGGWTPLGIGWAVVLSTLGSALVLLARVHHVLELRTAEFVRQVVLPNWAPFLVAALLAWPVQSLAAVLNRWLAAAMLLALGTVYAILLAWVVDVRVLSADERSEVRRRMRQMLAGIGWTRSEVTA